MSDLRTAICTRDFHAVEQCLNNENRGSGTPLTLAIELGYINIVKLLLNRGAHPDSRGHNFGGSCMYGTGLSIASMNGNNDIIELLLESGASINDNYHDGSPLHYAVKYNHLDTAKLLITRGANINNIDIFNRTPLFYARAPDITRLLLEHGANTEHQDFDRTAKDYIK